jgi:5'(3')-deoxyribonucleotidase
MDDTMADTVGEHLSRYNAEHGLSVSREEFHGKWLWDHVPEAHRPSLKRSMSGDDFFEELAVFPHAVRVLERLQQHYEIYIATAAMIFPNSFASKYRWLKRHVPFIPSSHYVYCGDKSILHADYLIDDIPEYLERFSGQGILFTQGHNVAETKYPRVKDWLEVEEYFLRDGIPRKA